MAINVFVLTEDLARLVTIESEVNTLRATFTPPLAPLTSDEIKLGTIQVGLNALLDQNDDPNTLPAYSSRMACSSAWLLPKGMAVSPLQQATRKKTRRASSGSWPRR